VASREPDYRINIRVARGVERDAPFVVGAGGAEALTDTIAVALTNAVSHGDGWRGIAAAESISVTVVAWRRRWGEPISIRRGSSAEHAHSERFARA
jgi:hypothetical protein